MQNPATDLQEMIKQLDAFQLPRSLMESFDMWREGAARTASREFSASQLSWFLDLLNRFRGPEDRRDSLLDVFDPGLYTLRHPAWEAPPGTIIELPALTSEVVAMAGADSKFAEVARAQIRAFDELAGTFSDEEIVGLAKIARAALGDQKSSFAGREDAVRYLALNASVLLQDLRVQEGAALVAASGRRIHFEDMVARRKAELSKEASSRPSFEETDFACYTDDQIRAFAFDMHKLFLTEREKHLAICSRCRQRLEYWLKLAENFDRAAPSQERKADA
jgi:hypothetical protein